MTYDGELVARTSLDSGAFNVEFGEGWQDSLREPLVDIMGAALASFERHQHFTRKGKGPAKGDVPMHSKSSSKEAGKSFGKGFAKGKPGLVLGKVSARSWANVDFELDY